jgi:DNA-binding MarR family transcriptional regulator/Fe2+ transport system protein FeoA
MLLERNKKMKVDDILGRVNQVVEDFYKLFYETENLALRQGIKCLTTTELHVIEAVGKESLSMNELSEKLGITMGTATVAVNKLSDKGFIDRKRSDYDRRKVFVSLSNKGTKALNYHDNYHNMIMSNITKGISKEELEAFTGVFEKILNNLNSQIDFIKPCTIIECTEDSVVNIVDIKGSPAVKNFFKDMEISIYSEVKVVKKTMSGVLVEVNENEFEINAMDAKNLIVVKKEL